MEQTLPQTKWKAWVLAARPKTLIAAAAPVILSYELALRLGPYSWGIALVCLLAACALQIGVNFHNDACDGVRGTDGPQRRGPLRAVAQGWIKAKQMRVAAYVCFGVAAILMSPLMAGNVAWLLPTLLVSIVAALAYTGGKRPLSHYGLGEVLAFCFFGPVPVIGASLLITSYINTAVILAGIACGLYATALMLANNIRDINEDLQAGKRTLVATLGKPGSLLLAAACLLTPGVLFAATGLSYYSTASLPLSIMALRALQQQPERALPLVSASYLLFTLGMLF